MTALSVGLTLAVIASIALNGSYLLQHAGSVRVPVVDPRHPVSTFAGLLTAPLWLAGLALGLTGWALHVAALSRAPLSLVQAFVAGGLALTVPAARRWLRRPIGRREALSVAGMAAALAVLPLGIGSDPATRSPAGLAALGFVLLAATVPAGLAASAIRLERPDLLAAAGGVLYGAADLAIKVLTGTFSNHGLGGVLSSPWLLVAAGLTLGAFFAFQRSLQLASPVTAIALMTAGTYVVSIGGALALLHDPLGHGAVLAGLHAAALAVVVASAWVLSRSQAELTRDAAVAT
jgi:drug/metabolite transporter (DMT)-like permease